MINLQIDIQMFSEFIPEVFLTLFILLPPKISPLSTQVQPSKVRKLLIPGCPQGTPRSGSLFRCRSKDFNLGHKSF